MNVNIDLSLLKREPEHVYHAQSDKNLSSHQLADFRRSPLLYFKRKVNGK